MKGKTKAFDPTKLVLITPNRRKSEPFDLRYTKAKRFRFSADAWNNLNLDTNGVSMFKYPGGGIIISIQAEDTSQVLKQREGSKRKGAEFTSTELAKLLGLTDQQADFELSLLSRADGVTYLTVSSFKEKQFTANAKDPEITDAMVAAQQPKANEKAMENVVDQNTEDQPSLGEPEESKDIDESKELDSSAFDDAEKEVEVDTDPLEFLEED